MKADSNTDRRSMTIGGEMDERSIVSTDFNEKIPYYVLRLISGANTTVEWWDDSGVVVTSCGTQFMLTKEQFQQIELVKALTLDTLKLSGVNPPFNTEDVIRAISTAKRVTRAACGIEPGKLKVLFLRDAENGVTFYRIIQPMTFLKQLADSPIHAEETDYLTLHIGLDFDALIAPRQLGPGACGILQHLQAVGRTVVYETDDLLDAIPNWNPNKALFKGGDSLRRNELQRRADGAIVSTPELRDAMPNKNATYVVPNAINPELWRVPELKHDGEIRILWAGTNTHEADLHMITPALKAVLRQEKRVKLVFVGYLPNAFKSVETQNGVLAEVVSPEYRGRVVYQPGCNVFQWPMLLASMKCHMAISPLKQHPFNAAKSELKVLEAWALGIPIVASRIAPYERAITDGVDGILVSDDNNSWETHILRLVRDVEARKSMGVAGNKALELKGYLAHQAAENMERALCAIALPKIQRPECKAAVEALLAKEPRFKSMTSAATVTW